MRFYLKVFAAVLVAVAVGYFSTAARACPQQIVAQGQCFQQQQVFAQQVYQPQAVVLQNVAPQYVVQQPQFVVQQQYGAQAVVVGHNRQQVIVRQQRAQKVVVQNGRQRSRQTVIVRNR